MNSTIMSHGALRVPLAGIAVGLLLGGALGCSKDDSSAVSNAAKLATPSPFSERSSRLIEGAPVRFTPNPNVEVAPGAAVEAPSFDRVWVTTEAEPDTGGAPLTVSFSATVEGDPPGSHYRWDFGDDTPPAHQRQAQHTYSQAGEYTATFSVTGPDVDEKDEVSITVNEDAFDFNLDTDPDIGQAPLTVQFNADIDEDLPGPFYFQWDFGDGGRDVSNPTSHRYTRPGEYTAMVTVTNAQGQHATRDVEIQVDAPDTE